MSVGECDTLCTMHASSLGMLSQKKILAHFLFLFYLHMTWILWKDVLELQIQAKQAQSQSHSHRVRA